MRANASAILVVAAVCGAGLLPAGPSTRAADPSAARPKWEYQVLSTDAMVELVKNDAAFKKAVPAGTFDELSMKRLLAPQFALNKLGDDGWELVAVRKADDDDSPSNRGSIYYLKRQK